MLSLRSRSLSGRRPNNRGRWRGPAARHARAGGWGHTGRRKSRLSSRSVSGAPGETPRRDQEYRCSPYPSTPSLSPITPHSERAIDRSYTVRNRLDAQGRFESPAAPRVALGYQNGGVVRVLPYGDLERPLDFIATVVTFLVFYLVDSVISFSLCSSR